MKHIILPLLVLIVCIGNAQIFKSPRIGDTTSWVTDTSYIIKRYDILLSDSLHRFLASRSDKGVWEIKDTMQTIETLYQFMNKEFIRLRKEAEIMKDLLDAVDVAQPKDWKKFNQARRAYYKYYNIKP